MCEVEVIGEVLAVPHSLWGCSKHPESNSGARNTHHPTLPNMTKTKKKTMIHHTVARTASTASHSQVPHATFPVGKREPKRLEGSAMN